MSNSIVSTQNKTSKEKIDRLVDQKLTITRVETNFERLPIWSPKPKRGTIFQPSKVIILPDEELPDGNRVKRKVEIVPSAKYGYPTVQTQEYWYALQKLWHDSEAKDAGRIDFSRRQIIVDVLGKSYAPKQRKALELSLDQLAGTLFAFDYTIYDKHKDEWLSEIRKFSLITDLHLTDKKSKTEVVHDKCSITLHPLIVSNLRCGYIKPILLSVVSQIRSDIGRLLYRKLDSHFAYYAKYEISTRRFFDEHAITGSEYHKPSRRKRLLEKAINELLDKPTSSNAVIARYEFAKTASGDDWKLLVWCKKTSKPQQTITDEQQPTVTPVEASESPTIASKVSVKGKPTPKTKKSVTGSTEALEGLRYFAHQFGRPNYNPDSKDITLIQGALDKQGMKGVKWAINYAQCELKNFKPRWFRAIKDTFEEGLKDYEKYKKVKAIQESDNAKIIAEAIEGQHQKQYQEQHQIYVLQRANEIEKEHPQQWSKFLEYENEKREKHRQRFHKNEKLQQTMLKSFDKMYQRVDRLVTYFEDKDIKILSFWEWDKAHNPDAFSKSPKNRKYM